MQEAKERDRHLKIKKLQTPVSRRPHALSNASDGSSGGTRSPSLSNASQPAKAAKSAAELEKKRLRRQENRQKNLEEKRKKAALAEKKAKEKEAEAAAKREAEEKRRRKARESCFGTIGEAAGKAYEYIEPYAGPIFRRIRRWCR